MLPFEVLFGAFVQSVPGCEAYERDPDDHNAKGGHADYLLFGRSVVAELKCLDEDQDRKFQAVATQLLADRGKVLYGAGRPFDEMFRYERDFDQANRDAVEALRARFRKDLHKANSQVRDTKAREGLAGAAGLAIVANVANPTLPLDLMRWVVAQDFGHERYSDTDAVLYLPVLAEQIVDLDSATKLVQCEVFYRPPETEGLHAKITSLLSQWSSYVGHGFADDLVADYAKR